MAALRLDTTVGSWLSQHIKIGLLLQHLPDATVHKCFEATGKMRGMSFDTNYYASKIHSKKNQNGQFTSNQYTYYIMDLVLSKELQHRRYVQCFTFHTF